MLMVDRAIKQWPEGGVGLPLPERLHGRQRPLDHVRVRRLDPASHGRCTPCPCVLQERAGAAGLFSCVPASWNTRMVCRATWGSTCAGRSRKSKVDAGQYCWPSQWGGRHGRIAARCSCACESLGWLRPRSLAARGRRSGLHRPEHPKLSWRRGVPCPDLRPNEGRLRGPATVFRRGSEEGRARCRCHRPVLHHRASAGLHRSRERGHRRSSDRQALPPCDHAIWRVPHGRARLESRGLRGRSQVREIFTKYRKIAQRRRLRCLYAGDHALPQERHHHRPAGRLRPWPHHRRLPPRGAVRHRPPPRRQEGRAGAARRHVGRPTR